MLVTVYVFVFFLFGIDTVVINGITIGLLDFDDFELCIIITLNTAMYAYTGCDSKLVFCQDSHSACRARHVGRGFRGRIGSWPEQEADK